jgi:hypothetical protein
MSGNNWRGGIRWEQKKNDFKRSLGKHASYRATIRV